jgi:hypothetical protein
VSCISFCGHKFEFVITLTTSLQNVQFGGQGQAKCTHINNLQRNMPKYNGITRIYNENTRIIPMLHMWGKVQYEHFVAKCRIERQKWWWRHNKPSGTRVKMLAINCNIYWPSEIFSLWEVELIWQIQQYMYQDPSKEFVFNYCRLVLLDLTIYYSSRTT